MNVGDRPLSLNLSRRDFLVKSLGVSCGVGFSLAGAATPESTGFAELPIVLFSKVYQELKLDFENAAALTAAAGLQGVDPTVRPGGEIVPEKAVEQLPLYFEALRKHNLQLPFITTAITALSSPHAEEILLTAKRLGVQFYRLGFIERQGDVQQQIVEVRARLKDLAQLNRQIGISAVFQNHSPSGHAYLGGDLREMRQIVAGFNPNEIGIAFDLGHALVVHGDDWRSQFEELKSHIKVAYVKDVNRQKQWVHLGEGQFAHTDYFKLLRQIEYRVPVCLHMEYDWSDHGKSKNRETLLKALIENRRVLRQWLAA